MFIFILPEFWVSQLTADSSDPSAQWLIPSQRRSLSKQSPSETQRNSWARHSWTVLLLNLIIFFIYCNFLGYTDRIYNSFSVKKKTYCNLFHRLNQHSLQFYHSVWIQEYNRHCDNYKNLINFKQFINILVLFLNIFSYWKAPCLQLWQFCSSESSRQSE